MTARQLYAIYVRSYADATRMFHAGTRTAEVEFARQAPRVTEPERLIATLALHDVTDGKPLRQAASFERALQNGLPLRELFSLRQGPPRLAS